MKIKEQIEILEALIEASDEARSFCVDNDYWSGVSTRGKEMLEHLKNVEMVSNIIR